MKKLDSNAKRAGELFLLKLKLAALGAKLVSDEGGRVCVQCPEQHRDEVARLMNEHGIVTS